MGLDERLDPVLLDVAIKHTEALRRRYEGPDLDFLTDLSTFLADFLEEIGCSKSDKVFYSPLETYPPEYFRKKVNALLNKK